MTTQSRKASLKKAAILLLLSLGLTLVMGEVLLAQTDQSHGNDWGGWITPLEYSLLETRVRCTNSYISPNNNKRYAIYEYEIKSYYKDTAKIVVATQYEDETSPKHSKKWSRPSHLTLKPGEAVRGQMFTSGGCTTAPVSISFYCVAEGATPCDRSSDNPSVVSVCAGASVPGARPVFGERQIDTTREAQEGNADFQNASAPQNSVLKKGWPSVLLDTDETCELTVDGDDYGLISSSTAKKFSVAVGEHVLKCTAVGYPDLVWRKVVETRGVGQTAELITLKPLQSQHDQATQQANAEKQKVEAEKQKADAAAEQQRIQAAAALRAADQQREIVEKRKQSVLGRLRELKAEWHSDTQDTIYYNGGCQAKVETHRVLTVSSIDENTGIASGTMEYNSDTTETTASAIFAGINRKDCSTLPNGKPAINIVFQSYNARVACGTDASQPCRVQVEAVSCEPNDCNTSYSFNVELEDGVLVSRWANEITQFYRK